MGLHLPQNPPKSVSRYQKARACSSTLRTLRLRRNGVDPHEITKVFGMLTFDPNQEPKAFDRNAALEDV